MNTFLCQVVSKFEKGVTFKHFPHTTVLVPSIVTVGASFLLQGHVTAGYYFTTRFHVAYSPRTPTAPYTCSTNLQAF